MKRTSKQILGLLFTAAVISLMVAAAPVEKTLGTNAAVVYLHGAWVWSSLMCFLAAALAGLAGLILKQGELHRWSQALGRAALIFWVINLALSLYVMQANWNGLFLDEPRFRIPLNFAIVGLLLQVGLSFLANPAATSLANLLFGTALFVVTNGAQTVLHPDSPIFGSTNAGSIQAFFIGLLFLLLAAAVQLAWLLKGLAGPSLRTGAHSTRQENSL